MDLKHSEESLISNTLRQEKVEDVRYSDKNETPNQKLNLVENVSEKYKYKPVNSYVSPFHFYNFLFF